MKTDFEDQWSGFFKFLLGVLFAILASYLVMLFRFELNWDEFLLLDWVYDWQEGNITLPLQTVYLRAFTWLIDIQGFEVHQIITARSVMMVCFLLTCVFIYLTSRTYFSREAAIFSVIAFITFSFVYRHGTSFRMDTMVTTTLMAVLFITTRDVLKLPHILLAGFLIGLAGMITVKAIFFIPTIAVILLMRWKADNWSRSKFWEGFCIGALSVLTFLGIYYLHSRSLVSGASGSEYITSVAGESLFAHGLFPKLYYISQSILQNPIHWGLLIIGVFSLHQMRLAGQLSANHYWVVLAFGFPLTTVIFYFHAFPYYFTFIMAPGSILISAAFEHRFRDNDQRYKYGLVLALLCLCLPTVYNTWSQDNGYQKQVVQAVHKMFPEPTAFIDRSSMIASFPKKGLFMGNWQMEEYYRNGTPIMQTIIDHEKPKFLLANLPSLDLDRLEQANEKRFLKDDEAVLRQNFVHHWGPLYILGKSLSVSQEAQAFSISVAGNYTVETSDRVVLNNADLGSGDVVYLEKGMHTVRAPRRETLTLKWGDNIYSPQVPPSGNKLFSGF